MKRKKMTVDQRHEAKVRALARKITQSPEWKEVRYILDPEENPRLQAFNHALQQEARRKIN